MTKQTPRPEVVLSTERTPRVAAARRLLHRKYRDQQRQFLAEGPQAVREALRQPTQVTRLYATPEASVRHSDLIRDARAHQVPITAITEIAAATLSETTTPQGLVAICSFIDRPLAAVTDQRPKLVVVLVEIRDPGNAGTVLRTADAAGADAVVFTSSSVDPYNGKAIRASAGSLFHPHIVRGVDADDAITVLRDAGLVIYATSADAKQDLFALAKTSTLAAPTAWIFGNEAHGLPENLAGLADVQVAIPIFGQAESLNLAVAAGVCLYASAQAHHAFRKLH